MFCEHNFVVNNGKLKSDKEDSGGGGWRRRDVGAVLLLLCVLLAAHLRILDYVTGEDPLTYKRLAFELLDARFSWTAWAELARFIMPGFPAILAVVIAVAGPVAVPWVNVFFMGAAFTMLYALYKRWGLTSGAGLVAGLVAIVLILQAFPMNAHFIFYAFRGAVHFLFIVAAFFVVQRADPVKPGWGLWLTGATLVLLLGATIRETALLAWPGLLAWALLHPEWRGARIKALMWLLAPILVIVGLVAVLWIAGRLDGNVQVRLWLGRAMADGITGYGHRILAYMHMIGTSLGWAGGALCVLALWFTRRRLHIPALWIVPGLLMAIFYAGYLIHFRYLLDTMLLLSVLAGLGAGATLDAVGAVRKKWVRPVVLWGSIATLIALNSVVIHSLPKWGPRVRLSHVRAFSSTIEELVGPNGHVFAHPYDRYLADVLLVFTQTQPLFEPEQALAASKSDPVLYVHPETRTYWRDHPFVDFTKDFLRYADLVPVEVEGRTEEQVRLATIRYSLYWIVPWADRVQEEDLKQHYVQGNLMWLDFRQSDPDARRHVRRLDGDGELVQEWTLEEGNGLIPFHVESPVRRDEPHRLVVESTSPLPRQMLTAPRALAGGGYFPVEGFRRLSVLDWIRPPARVLDRDSRWGGVFRKRAEVELPTPVGWTNGSYMVSFTLLPRWFEDRELVTRYALDGEKWMSFTNHLGMGHMYHDLVLEEPVGAQILPISIQTDLMASDTNHIAFVYIGARVKE